MIEPNSTVKFRQTLFDRFEGSTRMLDPGFPGVYLGFVHNANHSQKLLTLGFEELLSCVQHKIFPIEIKRKDPDINDLDNDLYSVFYQSIHPNLFPWSCYTRLGAPEIKRTTGTVQAHFIRCDVWSESYFLGISKKYIK